MATPDEIEAFIRNTRPPWNTARQRYDWYGMCAGLTYRTIRECGGYVPSGPYGSAWLAYLDTRIESRDHRTAPPGAVHYWDYVGVASNGQRARWGHVSLDILGRGTDTLSATGYAHEFWNTSAGLISVPAQTARGMTYMGWSRTYGAHIRINIELPAPAVEEPKPLPPVPVPEIPEKEDDTMKVFGYIKPGDKRTTYVTMDFTGGLWDEFVTDDIEYVRSVAEKWGNGAPLLSVKHRDSLRAKFEKRWPGN